MPLFEGQTAGVSPLTPVTANSTVTTTSVLDVLVPTMTITPAAGVYLVFFVGNTWGSTTGAGIYIATSIYFNGAQNVASELRVSDDVNFNESFSCVAIITADGVNAIEGRWRRVGGGTASMLGERTLTLLEIG